MALLRTSQVSIALACLLGVSGCSSSAAPEDPTSGDASAAEDGIGKGDGSPGHPSGDASKAGSDSRAPVSDAPAPDATCSAISHLAVTATSATSVTLSWTGAPGVAVRVTRETYCGTDSYTTLATLPAGATSYTNSSVQADWVYWYEITATDGSDAPASAAIATQAGSSPVVGCAPGATSRTSGVAAGACATSTGGDGGQADASPPPNGNDAGDGAATKDSATGDSGSIVPAYYVSTTGKDSNPGTVSLPFLTLAKAQTAMQTGSIKTTYIRAGSYTLPTLSCGGSSCGLNLTGVDDGETWSYYPPDGVDSADLSGGSTSNGNGLVTAVSVSANNIIINGLSIHDFQYAGIGSGGGVNNLLVENCVIFNGYTASGSSNPAGISCYGCGNTTISHNVIHDMAQFAVSMSNVNGNISNLLVTGNVVYNTCTQIADCGALYVQDITTTATNLSFTNNYIHDGNTFATLGSNSGCALYADDCTSNVTESGNVVTGRNGSNTMMVHGGSNIHQVDNLIDLTSYAQHVAVFQTSGVSACSSAEMSGNEFEHNVIIGEGGGGGYALLSGSPQHTPTISDNDYYNYGGAAISSGSGGYSDSSPSSVNPQLSGWTYTVASGSPVLGAPVSFTPLVGGWGPPGYVLPTTGTAPSSPH